MKLGSDFIAGNWLDGSWLQAKSANADFLTQTEYLIDDSNDFKWNIEESGYYIVTVDLNANKIAVQRRYFDYMTLSGPGSPIGGWNKPEGDINTDFLQTSPNSNIWTFTGMLKVGQVKIHAKIGSDFIADNWLDGSWLQAKSNNADFRTAAEYIIDSSNDYKWNVAQAGLYKITVDLTKGLLSVKRLDYDHLTLVGPGSPSGSWIRPEGDITTDLARTAPDSNIWTFTGALNAGEIKIHAKLGTDFISNNWEDGNWLYSDAVNADFLTAARYRVDGTDTKWNIAEAGVYNITVNLAKELLTVQKVDQNSILLQKNSLSNKPVSLVGNEVSIVQNEMVVYPNPTSGLFSIQIKRPKSAKATVYIFNLNGAVLQKRNIVFSEEVQNFEFNITGATSGIYLIKVDCLDGVTQNLILQN